MNEAKGFVCTNCHTGLDPNQGNWCLCQVCHWLPLCMQCALVSELAICQVCDEQQIQQVNAKEVAVKDMKKCDLCQGVWKLKVCHVCQGQICATCFSNYDKHPCDKCAHCHTKQRVGCCGRKWCRDCLTRYHQITDCERIMYYHCPICRGKVLQFGNERFRCPVPNCQLIFACQKDYCQRTVKLGRVFCFDHTSPIKCSGCHLSYPLDGTQGHVRILQLLGAKPRKREYCGVCHEQLRAMIQAVLLMGRRNEWRIPKVLIDMLIFRFGFAFHHG